MGKKKIRVPTAQRVRYELLDYDRLVLRKRSPAGQDARLVDMSIEMSLREWKRLRKAIRTGRDWARKKRKATTIHRSKPVRFT